MKKLYFFLMALCLGFAANADYYVIGSNVNGKNWALAASDAKMTPTGTNTYEWTGTTLGTGFKINDGTWSNDAANFGSNGSELTPGVPYTMGTGGSSGNIALKGATEIKNPKIVLDVTDASKPVITVTGNAGGEIKWYLCGINGTFNADGGDGSIELKKGANANELKSDAFQIKVSTGEFKIASTGWAKEYGQNSPVTISADNMSATLEEVYGEAGNLPYNLAAGTYYCSFNLSTLKVTFSTDDNGGGGGDNPPAGDGTVTWVNVGGTFNGDDYYNDGQQPDSEGIATFTDLAIGTSGFKVKTWNEDIDVYYVAETPSIPTDQWVQLYEDIYDAPGIVIDGAESNSVYTLKFNVKTNQVYLTLTGGGNGGGGGDNPPAGDGTVTWVNVGGTFNGDDYYNNGQQPDSEGIATFTDLAIGTSGFKVKTWDEDIDVYYVADTPSIPTDQWVQLYEDIYDAPGIVIDGAESSSVYTLKYNVKTNQVYVTLTGGGNGGGDNPDPDQPVDPDPNPGTDKDLYLVGSVYGNWSLDTNYKFTQNGNVYTITLPSGVEAGEYGWKIWDGSWDYSFGCGESQPEIGVEYETWFDAGNFTISTTTETTITLTVVAGSDIKNSDIPSKLLITAKSDGIDSIGADVTEAVYYNLQGVRVANPENGIYIMRQGSKVTKIMK